MLLMNYSMLQGLKGTHLRYSLGRWDETVVAARVAVGAQRAVQAGSSQAGI